ncbi:MAG: THUMP domain-containing protein [archaeon]
MQFIALTHRGIEDVARKELEELGAKSCEESIGCVAFESDISTVIAIIHRAQSISRVLASGWQGTATSPDEIAAAVKKDGIKESSLFSNQKTFKVATDRSGDHGYASDEVNRAVGGTIIDKYGLKADMETPDALVFVRIIDQSIAVGIDLSGELAVRHYKIFTSKASLKGTVGYALLRLSGFSGKGMFLDPYCADGVVAIEATLLSKKMSPRHFEKKEYPCESFEGFAYAKTIIDKLNTKTVDTRATIKAFDELLHNVSCARKNAKIAGVNKEIEFSRSEVEWLDTKLEEKSIDAVATFLPLASRNVKESTTNKIFKEFFYQCDFILKPKGGLAVLTNAPGIVREYAEEYKLSIDNEREVWQGQQAMWLFVFSKQKQ